MTRVYENPMIVAKSCSCCSTLLVTIAPDSCDCVKLTCPNCGRNVMMALAFRRHRKKEYVYSPNSNIKIGEKVQCGNETLIKITKDGKEDYISFADLVAPFLQRKKHAVAVPPMSEGYREMV